jgi:hypothetical protein
MKVENDCVIAVKDRSSASEFELEMALQSDAVGPIHDGSMVHICCQKQWMMYSKGTSSSKPYCGTTKDVSAAVSFVISSKLQTSLGVDLYVGVDSYLALRSFEQQLLSKSLFASNQAYFEHSLKYVTSCLDFLRLFLSTDQNIQTSTEAKSGGFSVLTVGNKNVILEDNVMKTKVKQGMLRDQGLLDVLLDIIDMMSDPLDQDVFETTKVGRRSAREIFNAYSSCESICEISDINSPILVQSKSSLESTLEYELVTKTLTVLHLAILDNRSNQMYISNKFALLLNQVPNISTPNYLTRLIIISK